MGSPRLAPASATRPTLRLGLLVRRRLSGAPRRRRGRAAAAVVLPIANAEAMNLHLAAISDNVAAGAHAVLVIDGAGYHQPSALHCPANISLLTLPPYSPQLNPVENVWQYLRQNFLANSIFDTYEDILEACCAAWNKLIALPDRLASITQRDWAVIR